MTTPVPTAPPARHRVTALSLIAVAVGGSIGALLRWSLGEAFPHAAGFPWTIFAINVSGAFVLALLHGVTAVSRRHVLAVGLGPGLLGGYTTLSAYAEDSRALWAAGDDALAAAYVFGTLAACLVAVALATSLVRGKPA